MLPVSTAALRARPHISRVRLEAGMPNIFCTGGQQPLEGVGPGPLALAVGALDGRLSGLDKVGRSPFPCGTRRSPA